MPLNHDHYTLCVCCCFDLLLCVRVAGAVVGGSVAPWQHQPSSSSLPPRAESESARRQTDARPRRLGASALRGRESSSSLLPLSLSVVRVGRRHAAVVPQPPHALALLLRPPSSVTPRWSQPLPFLNSVFCVCVSVRHIVSTSFTCLAAQLKGRSLQWRSSRLWSNGLRRTLNVLTCIVGT